MSPRHNRRVRDAILRNSRPTKQLRLIDAYRRKMPEKGTTITIHYDDKHKDRLEQIKRNLERWGLKAKFKKVEK